MAYGDIPAAGAKDEGVMSDEGMAPESVPAPAYSDEETAAIAEAFPDLAGDPMRLAAFKTAVQMCVDRALERGEGGGSEPPPAMKSGKGGSAKAPSALVLAFGGKPKGKA